MSSPGSGHAASVPDHDRQTSLISSVMSEVTPTNSGFRVARTLQQAELRRRTGDLIKLGLEGGREAIVHKVGEVGLQEGGQHAAEALRVQRLALLAHVLAVLRQKRF